MSLFLADSGLISGRGGTSAARGADQTLAEPSASTESSGELLEFSMVEPPALLVAAAAFETSLIKMTDLSTISPPNPDASGVAYVPSRNSLMVVDGEVEETISGITHFEGANVWELTRGGSFVRAANISPVSPTVVPMSDEPTGIAWNPNNGHYYVTDDTGSIDVYDLNPGADGLIGTSDDTWVGYSLSSFGVADAEGIAYDTWNNTLFIADGVNREVYHITLTGGLIDHFDVLTYGVEDPEAVEFNPFTGTLYVMSSNRSTGVIAETTTSGQLIQTIDISAANIRTAAGLAYGPASTGSGAQSFYIVDRGVDNDSNPNLIDGKLYELSAPSAGPAPTATSTATPTRTPTATSTFTPGPSPSPTPTLSQPSSAFLASFESNGTVGGLTFADEDIVRFNGSTWSLFFDGSDVGLDATDVIGFHVLDSDSILLTFNTSIALGGQTFAPTDIVRFDATVLGDATVGTFSLYFNGIDVGLDVSSDNLDALDVLSDGRILVSTTGDPTVPGLSSPADEDILAFTPSSLGATTSGSWAMYFEGSDVALGATSEDIDAVDVHGNGNIYLSTLGDFAVTGVSGFDEDVFVCSPTSLGSVTACNFSSVLFFDGSAVGLGANDVDAFNLLESGTFPTATPTHTPTNTPLSTATFTPTNTSAPAPTSTPTLTPTTGPSPTPTNTPLPTNTPTNTPLPTNTATPTNTSVSNTLTLTAVADARVLSSNPTINYGTLNRLDVDNPGQESYVRFTVSGVTGAVQSATVRLFVTNGSSNGPSIYGTDNSWTETGITWNNRPVPTTAAIANAGAMTASTWVEYNVTAYVTGNGTYNFVLLPDGSDGVTLNSREGASPPQLVLTFASGPTPTPSNTPPPVSTDTPTNTPTAGPSPTPSNTPTATNTPLPTPTPTNTPISSSVTFVPVADARVLAASPTTNYGTLTRLDADSPGEESYIRFTVSGVSGTIQNATLRLFVTNGSSNGPSIYGTSNTWTETGITWNTRPAATTGAIANLGAAAVDTWVEYNVTAYITSNGTFDLVLIPDSTSGVTFSSREGTFPPQLVLTLAP
jgi:hypothetical protein